MIDKQLLDILCCPETKQNVSRADIGVISKINDAINAGTLTNRGGAVVKEPLTDALIRDDKKVVYPVRDDIPVMLIDESIAV